MVHNNGEDSDAPAGAEKDGFDSMMKNMMKNIPPNKSIVTNVPTKESAIEA